MTRETQTTLDAEIEAMSDEHWELGRGKHRFLLIYMGDHWTLREMDKANVYPPCDKKTKREIASRLLQVMKVGPVAPQIGPEEHRVTIINDEPVKGPAND